MTQPVITLSANGTVLTLDPDLHWTDEFAWHVIEQSVQHSITGALLIDEGVRLSGRPITLAPPDDSAAWLPRATLSQLQTWEAVPALTLQLSLQGVIRQVMFRRFDSTPLEARPVIFVADPVAGEIGDWFLTTLRFIEV